MNSVSMSGFFGAKPEISVLVGIMMLGLGMTLAMTLIGERGEIGEIGVTYTCIYSALLSWEDPYGLSPH